MMEPGAGWDGARVRAVIDPLTSLDGALLPMLHALQDTFGYVDPRAIPLVAAALQLSQAEVVGVISFYHEFRTTPPGRHHLQLCRAEACQACGSEALVDHLRHHHGLEPGQTSADGALSLDEVYCLGNCALGPSLLLDGEPLGRATPAALDRLLEATTGDPAEARRTVQVLARPA